MATIINKLDKPSSRHHLVQKAEKQALVKAIKVLIKEVYSGNFSFGNNFSISYLIQIRFSVSFPMAEAWFIESEGKAIMQAVIDARINKVKELLVYTDIAPADIAGKLNYFSPAAMEDELLQQTGLSISFFREMRKRKANLTARPACCH